MKLGLDLEARTITLTKSKPSEKEPQKSTLALSERDFAIIALLALHRFEGIAFTEPDQFRAIRGFGNPIDDTRLAKAIYDRNLHLVRQLAISGPFRLFQRGPRGSNSFQLNTELDLEDFDPVRTRQWLRVSDSVPHPIQKPSPVESSNAEEAARIAAAISTIDQGKLIEGRQALYAIGSDPKVSAHSRFLARYQEAWALESIHLGDALRMQPDLAAAARTYVIEKQKKSQPGSNPEADSKGLSDLQVVEAYDKEIAAMLALRRGRLETLLCNYDEAQKYLEVAVNLGQSSPGNKLLGGSFKLAKALYLIRTQYGYFNNSGLMGAKRASVSELLEGIKLINEAIEDFADALYIKGLKRALSQLGWAHFRLHRTLVNPDDRNKQKTPLKEDDNTQLEEMMRNENDTLQNLTSAENCFLQSTNLTTGGNRATSFSNYNDLGLGAVVMARAAMKGSSVQIEEALSYLDRGREAAESAATTRQLANAYYWLARYYKRVGNLAKLTEYLELSKVSYANAGISRMVEWISNLLDNPRSSD